ncbi:DNA mismatch repair endonuclease MutL [Flexithrix dorotheae]|uniref:DNA mismatch repair endonuclease MutL n=1 Tax=Flexithrix dorotheae TaxID=70993 RepID=UPI00037A2F9D|nr:DNA mismatch repair endonuclease MutL [Flexithrix dorotheae]
MQDVIKLLPESLANQIAAGEVVQRPASVVKELIENAIDAKSEHITLIIKDAGKSLVQVSDDGIGMSERDARMCFERHATSKIETTEDLFKIMTFGFRGEAMASIAAVAQVDLKSKTKEEEIGTRILIEGSEIKTQEPVACNDGTSIAVKNLFFNVPARRNFLKSNPVETKHIFDEFQRVALAHPKINMALYQDDLEVYSLKEGKLAKRIVSIFGKNYQTQLIACKEDVQHVQVNGYIGKPEFSKKTRGEQFFFVNDRFIKHPYLHHAVMNAFEGLLPEGNFPFYVLKIYIDPVHVDINVHPTKTEVKFDDERTIYAVVRAAVRQALASQGVSPSLDFDYNVNFAQYPDNIGNQKSSYTENDYKSPENPLDDPEHKRRESNQQHWDSLMPSNDSEKWMRQFDQEHIKDEEQKSMEITFSSAANEMQSEQSVENPVPEEKVKKQKTIQVRNKYILAQVKSGIMLIHQQAAHERILFERFLGDLENSSGVSQKLVFPVTVELNPVDFTLLGEIKEEVLKLGFDFEEFGQNAIILNGIPSEINKPNEKELVEKLIEQIKINKAELGLNTTESIAKALAKRVSIKVGQYLDSMERDALIEQLFSTSNPNYNVDGEKIITMLDLTALDNLFNQ